MIMRHDVNGEKGESFKKRQAAVLWWHIDELLRIRLEYRNGTGKKHNLRTVV
jgi:hypothetical protein